MCQKEKQMKNKLSDVLYNPGSINTCQDKDLEQSQEYQTPPQDLNESDYELLKRLEELIIAEGESHIDQKLISFYNQLFSGINPGIRPTIIKEFNNYLHRTSLKHPNSTQLFHQCLQIIIEFKNQIDKQNPAQACISKEEWIELERALFFLTQWEYKLGIKIEEMVLFEENNTH